MSNRTDPQQPAFDPTCSDNDKRHEVVDGQFVELPMKLVRDVFIINDLGRRLSRYARDREFGWVHMFMLFDFGRTDAPQRRPDISFVSTRRWPLDRRISRVDALPVVPELAVEVIAARRTWPRNSWGRLASIFEAGVQKVWVVFPKHRLIYAYDAADTIRVLQDGDDLDGGEIIPGFRLPVSELFGAE